MNWTREQEKAITLRDKNILVAAAAGSGKTAVLVERIKGLILEDHCPIDRMLIVTFTNAAAAEMKEKIYRSLNEAVEKLAAAREGDLSEKEKEKLAFLKKQLHGVSLAQISTFHAFALEIIRRYFYVIQAEPNFRICDDTQQTLLRGEAMDELLEELFDEGEERFFSFLKAYSGDRNENRFRDMVDKVYDTIQSLPEPYLWLEEKVEALRRGLEENGEIMQFLHAEAENRIQKSLKLCGRMLRQMREYNLNKAAALLEEDLAQLEEIQASRGNYDDLRQALASFKLGALRKTYFSGAGEEADRLKREVEKVRNEIKEQMRDLYQKFFLKNRTEAEEEMAATYDDACFLKEVVIRYGEIFRQKKKKRNLMDFSDIEHAAYEILKDEQVAKAYREKFCHIFVDEYQDSNVIQEAFLEKIKRENNLFLVGDVKQSIYKFRLAEPEIFQRRYRQYADPEETLSEKIELNRNFRSKKPVVDFINEIFSSVMEEYDDNAALHLGDPYGDRFYEEPKVYLASAPWTDGEEMDDELKNILKAEKEALAAVKLIQDHLGKPIFDSKTGEERPLALRDIVILMRGVRNYGDIFYHILTENQIAAYVDDNDGYFDTMEINTFLSLLSLLDNKKQDIPLLTVLRSELMGFTIEELAAVRMDFKEGSYYDAFSLYGKEGKEKKLRDKCGLALTRLRQWREMAIYMPLEELVWKLMLDSGFYIAMGAMPGGTQRQANLRALVDKALAFRKGQGGSLYGFIRYIETVKERKVASGQVKLVGEKDELVKIMTIHKSKGLEFPMVILAGYCRRLNYTSLGKSLVVHKDLGLGFPLVNPEQHWFRTTVLQNIIKEKFHREEAEEEKRIFYVALTRAKDRLAILGILNDVEGELEKVAGESPKDGSYFQMTGGRLCADSRRFQIIDDGQLADLVKGQRRYNRQGLRLLEREEEGKEKNPWTDQIERQMEFVYPGEKELTIKSKYSVSELNAAGRRPAESLEEPACFKRGGTFTAVQRGTIYHTLLEHLDFKKAAESGDVEVKKTLENLIQKQFLTTEEAAVIRIEKIRKLIRSPLGRRMADASALFREKPFNLKEVMDGTEVIVQGVVDCYFEEENQLVLVDYKTGFAERKDEEEGRRSAEDRYRTQIQIYRRALEITTGKQVKEAYIYLIDSGEAVKIN